VYNSAVGEPNAVRSPQSPRTSRTSPDPFAPFGRAWPQDLTARRSRPGPRSTRAARALIACGDSGRTLALQPARPRDWTLLRNVSVRLLVRASLSAGRRGAARFLAASARLSYPLETCRFGRLAHNSPP